MTSSADADPLRSPALRTTARWWQSAARAAGGVPPRSALDPLELRSALAKVWLVRWDRSADTLVYRLAGEDIVHAFRVTPRNRSVSDLLAPDQAAGVGETLRRVCRDRLVCRQTGAVYAEQDRGLLGERLMLPLAGASVAEAYVLGATDADYRRGAHGDTGYDSAWYDIATVLAWPLA